MKKLVAVAIILSFVIAYLPVFAAETGKKVTGTTAPAGKESLLHRTKDKIAKVNESVFQPIGDWFFSIVGKSSEEKARIISERKARRAAQRVEKEARKAQK